mgnify:CR=1 FL=1
MAELITNMTIKQLNSRPHIPYFGVNMVKITPVVTAIYTKYKMLIEICCPVPA